MVTNGLLVRVVGAPSTFLVHAIAFLSGLSLTAAIGSALWASEKDFDSVTDKACDYGRMLADETDKWRNVIRGGNIKLQ
jgi:hypothetical protein